MTTSSAASGLAAAQHVPGREPCVPAVPMRATDPAPPDGARRPAARAGLLVLAAIEEAVPTRRSRSASARQGSRRRRRRLPSAARQSEEHTSELQSRENLVCRLLLEKNKTI